MGESPRIDDQDIRLCSLLLNMINNGPFVVGLKKAQGMACVFRFSLQPLIDLRQGGCPIYPRLSGAQEIEVWAMNDQNVSHVLFSS
jgi:hypothetical protein